MKTKKTPEQLCVDYILDTEMEDFAENPSKDHVYYQALISFYGKEEAEKYLKEAIKDLR